MPKFVSKWAFSNYDLYFIIKQIQTFHSYEAYKVIPKKGMSVCIIILQSEKKSDLLV